MYVEIVPVTFPEEELLGVSNLQLFSYNILAASEPRSHLVIPVEMNLEPRELGYVEYLEAIGGLKCIKFFPYKYHRPPECGRRVSDAIQLLIAEDICSQFSGDIGHSTFGIDRIVQLQRLNIEVEEWYPAEEYLERIRRGIKESIYK